MLSFLLTLSLFLFWTVIGRAILVIFASRLGVLRSWLLSPALGFALLGLIVMVLNQAGFPVKEFAWPLGTALGVISTIVLFVKRPLTPFRSLWPFVVATLGSLVWTAWPALKFNFSWISIVNDDFTNYCLAAERFKDFGFYRLPTTQELLGKDYSHYYWFMHVIGLMRFGAEHMLSWLSSITKLPALEIFMPTIMAFAMTQLFSIAGLVLSSGKRRKIAVWTVYLLSFSPMFLFGSLYQLIAQVSGLSLLFCLVALLTASYKTRSRRVLLCYAVPTSIVGASLCTFYPEVSPFAIMAIGLFYAYRLIKDKTIPGAHLVLLQYSILGILFILRYNFISYIYTLANQFEGNTRKVDLALSVFPFFLIPSGLSSIFGLQAMNQDVPDPWGSIIIILGFLLLVGCIFYAFKAFIRGVPFAFLFVVELVMAIQMYRTGNDFGLYKMVMFMLPLILAAGASLILESKWRLRMPHIAAIYFILTISTALIYTEGSCGSNVGLISEVSHASELFNIRPKSASSGSHWTSTIDNVSAAKVAASLYRSSDMSFICRDYFLPIFSTHPDWPYLNYYPHYEQFSEALKIASERKTHYFVRKAIFDTYFTQVREPIKTDAYLGQSSDLSLFNKFNLSKEKPALFYLEPSTNTSNRISFIHSDRGNHYYLGDRHRISYFQQESDYYGTHSQFNGIGQFMLLRIENPSPQIYLRVSATKTLMGNGNNTWNSEAKIIGQNNVNLGAIGSGAMNVIAGPITPYVLDGISYIALDFNQPAVAMPTNRHGIKAFYNANINLDYRRLVAYGRDISALSPDEYKTLERPRGLGNFPSDMVDSKGLEYSGIYEDGWISPDSHFVLAKSEMGDQIRIKGYIPDLEGVKKEESINIQINGKDLYRVDCTPGEFDWALPIDHYLNVTTIDLHSSVHAHLAKPDLRPVTAKLSYIGLESKGLYTYAYSGQESAKPLSHNVGSDGWAAPQCEITVPVSTRAKALVLKLEYPGWPGIGEHVQIALRDGSSRIVHAVLNQGMNEVVFPYSGNLSHVTLKIESDHSFKLPAPDSRLCSFRIATITARE